jgi:hypothetical protein
MITDAIITAVLAPITWLLAQLPTVTMPGWVDDIVGYFGFFGDALASLGNWIPVEHIAPALGLVLAAVSASFIIKVARIVFSMIWPGAGST